MTGRSRIQFAFLGSLMLAAGLLVVGCDQQSGTTGVTASTDTSTPTETTPPDKPSNAQTSQPTQPAQASLPSPVAGPPPVVFDPPVLDFGILTPGESADTTLTIKNIGDHPLTIASTKVSCTCTTIDLKDTSIMPGETVSMDVRYKGKLVLGPSTAKVRVLFENYEDYLREIDVKAEIALAIRAEPAFIMATQADYGQFRVASQDERPFNVLAVNGKAPSFVNYDPLEDDPRNAYFLKWDVREYDPQTCTNAAGQPMPSWLAIETDHPDCQIFDVYLRHLCTVPKPPPAPRNWVLSDPRTLIGTVGAGESYDFDINMRFLRGAAPDDRATSVTAQSEVFTAELLEAVPKDDVVQLKIRITPTASHRGLIYEKIWVHGTKGSAELLIVGKVVDPTV